MSWGSSFWSAWNASTDFVKSAAAAVATGALAVGKAGVAASKWTASKTVDTAKWAAEENATAARWIETKVAQGDKIAKQVAIAGMRGTAKMAGRSGLDLLGDADQAIGRKVSTALDKVRSIFSDRKPAEPVASCPLLKLSKDVDLDGTLLSYPGGKCDAVTSKGQKVGPEAIANAETNAYESQSGCCQTKRRNGIAPRTIVYVNGINTSESIDCETLKAIGNATCAKVYAVYNATEGFYRDAVQTSQDRKAIAAANAGHSPRTGDGRNPAVDTLSALIQSKRLNDEPLELWAHSQGGAISSLALYDAQNALKAAHVPGATLNGVQVKSFGSAAPQWPNGPEYEHYVHVNDFTPVTYGLGDDAAGDGIHAGEGAKVIRFSGDPSDRSFETDHLQKSAMPVPTANHDITGIYLKMEKQEHACCD